MFSKITLKHSFQLKFHLPFNIPPPVNPPPFIILFIEIQCKQDKFDEFISHDEGLFERNMKITKHKSHLSNI